MFNMSKKKVPSVERVQMLEKRVIYLEKRVVDLEEELSATQKALSDLQESVNNSSSAKKAPAKKKADKPTPEALSKEEKRAARIKRELNKTLPTVMKRMGWTREQAEEHYKITADRIGCTPTEYMLYRLHEMTEEEQDTVFLMKYQKVLHKRWDTNSDFLNMLRDKERTNNYFSEFIRRPWCVNTKVTFDQFLKSFKNSKRIIYKPISGHCGYGVEAFDLTDTEAIKDAYDKLSTYPEGVVEEYIVQHPKMMELCPSSVNSLRVVTFSSYSKPPFDDGSNYEIAYAGLRIGQGKSIVDNLHSGGMVANVDLSTGTLINNAADCTGRVFEKHPDTGTTIKGFKIPCFDEALNMIRRAIEKNKVEGYIGWDIAISEKGPMFLEVNGLPGVVVLQTATAQEGKGMKYVMEKYL